MTYIEMKKILFDEFKRNDDIWQSYISTSNSELLNTRRFYVDSTHQISINYPGMKTKKRGNTIYYDFRVDYRGVAISHPSIIIDLYNKALQYDDITLLKKFLISIAKSGNSTNFDDYRKLSSHMFKTPSKDLIERANTVFNKLRKPYLSRSNLPYNFEIEVMVSLIPWITLQEDINYPIENGYEGRRMPYSRYLEAIECPVMEENGIYHLEDVIERSLAFTRPLPYHAIDYKEIMEIRTV